MEKQYYYIDNGEKMGPLSLSQLMGMITPDTFIWTEGYADWQQAKNIPELAPQLALPKMPPAFVPPAPMQPPPIPGPYNNQAIATRSSGIGLAIVSTAFFLLSFIAKCAATGLLFGNMGSRDYDSYRTGAKYEGFANVISFLLLIPAIICFYVLLYNGWSAIQDRKARTTPGKAIGFLFIPFFNFYWNFVAFFGWTKDTNNYIAAHTANAKRVSEVTGVMLAIAVILQFFGSIIFVVAHAKGVDIGTDENGSLIITNYDFLGVAEGISIFTTLLATTSFIMFSFALVRGLKLTRH